MDARGRCSRRVVLGLGAAVALTAVARPHVAAQDAACDGAIGTHTPTGLEFHGTGSTISEPFPMTEGAVFATSAMSEAGAIKLMNAAGDTVLLHNAAEAHEGTEAATVYAAGDYYLVVDFYSDEGDWSLTIEQPAA